MKYFLLLLLFCTLTLSCAGLSQTPASQGTNRAGSTLMTQAAQLEANRKFEESGVTYGKAAEAFGVAGQGKEQAVALQKSAEMYEKLADELINGTTDPVGNSAKAASIMQNPPMQTGTTAENRPVTRGPGTTAGGFAAGHMLKGRYKLDGEQESYTFYVNGTFKHGNAVAGVLRGGEYAAGATDAGNYYVSGKTLTLTYTGRPDSVEHAFDIQSFPSDPDYSQQSPGRLRIHNAIYTYLRVE